MLRKLLSTYKRTSAENIPDKTTIMNAQIAIRDNLKETYKDVYTPEVIAALTSLAHFNNDIKMAMAARIKRRAERQQTKQRIAFPDPESIIPRTSIKVKDARAGKFEGSVIPRDLLRQWIQGTGPAAKPRAPLESSIRNVAYALLSGADGWMFDGEDALVKSIPCHSTISAT